MSAPKTPRYSISPVYSHRVTLDEQMAAYASPQEAFDQGDYLFAAQSSAPGSELKGCACLLAGFLDQGIRTLEGLGQISDRGKVYLGYGYWCLKRQSDAVKTLSQVGNGISRGLAERLKELV